MNVLITNQQETLLSGLSVEIIKTLRGEYEAEEIIGTFSNFFFGRMILDFTSIKNYQNISNIQKLSIGLPVEKIILLLPANGEYSTNQYLSKLISMGFYNFTTNLEGVEYLINNPNTYKDVAPFHLLGGSSNKPAQNSGSSSGFGNSGSSGNEQSFINSSMGGQTIKGTRVIGVKSLTDHGGATTLVYMLKKQLSEYYSVLGVELDKNDFLFFNDEDLKSISTKDFQSVVNNPVNNYNVILVDVNEAADENLCSEMIYLIEPSTLMLNKMIRRDRNVLDKIKGKKVILNKSLLDPNDVRKFEAEARCAIFQNIPPLDDKKEKHRVLDEFLNKLGFDKNKPVGDGNRSARLFGIVKE